MGLILYEGLGFTGPHKHVFNRDEVDLSTDNWAGRACSAQVMDGNWKLYEAANHGAGASVELVRGSYDDLHGSFGFQPASVQLLNAGPNPYGLSGVILHLHRDYKGAHRHIIDRDDDNLHAEAWGDEVSSIQVVSGRWRFFQHPNQPTDYDYRGWSVELGPGIYPVGRHGGIANDHLSSVRRVAPDWEINPLPDQRHAILYRHHQYRGRHRHLFVGGDDNLHQSGFGDQVSSAQVSAGTWSLYEHVNYGGASATINATVQNDYPNAAALGLTNDTLSSVRAFVLPIIVVVINGYSRLGVNQTANQVVTGDLNCAKQVFGPRGIEVVELARIHADAPGLLNLIGSSCVGGVLNNPTIQERSLFEIGRHGFPDIAMACYLDAFSASAGCYTHPAGHPGVSVSNDSTCWTLSHEIGHLLGLSHELLDNTNIMFPSTQQLAQIPPLISDPQFATLKASPYLV